MVGIEEKTILVIDDEETIRQSFTDYLEDMGCRVLTAENGRAGVDMFGQENVDLVLVDLRMPEMDGLEVLAHISQNSPDAPLIVVSGTGVISDAVEALHQGAWDYILKPVKDLSVLAHAVDMALEKARLKRENRRYQQHLEQMVADRTKALEESEALLDAMGKMAKVGGWELDANTRKIKWTRQAYRMFELPFDYEPNIDATDRFHPSDREIMKDALRRGLERGEPSDFELRLFTAKGKNLWIHSICIPQVVDGKVVKLKGTFQDISNRKQMELEQEKLITKLQEALAEIKELRGFLPICANCKKVRDDDGYWQEVEKYIMDRTDATFSHGICPDCLQKFYPDHYKRLLEKKKSETKNYR